jgi:hypothetical protein
MKRLLLFLTLSFQVILAQSEVIITSDSVMVFRTKAAWKERSVPQGYEALYLPDKSPNAGRRAVWKRIWIPAAVATGAFLFDMGVVNKGNPCSDNNNPYAKRDCYLPLPATMTLGTAAATYSFIVAPLAGNLAYKDKRRAWIGTAIRVGGHLFCVTGNEQVCNAGIITGYVAGTAYHIVTIPKSRQAYQERIERYRID